MGLQGKTAVSSPRPRPHRAMQTKMEAALCPSRHIGVLVIPVAACVSSTISFSSPFITQGSGSPAASGFSSLEFRMTVPLSGIPGGLSLCLEFRMTVPLSWASAPPCCLPTFPISRALNLKKIPTSSQSSLLQNCPRIRWP